MTLPHTFLRQARKLERIRARRRFVKRWTSKPLDRVTAIMLATVFVLFTTALVALGYGIILALLNLTIPLSMFLGTGQ